MRLSYKTSGSAGSFTVLADESSRTATLEVAAPSFSRLTQIEPLVRAASVATFDRGNVSVQLPIVATITYASRAAALASVATFAALYTGRNDLKLEQDATTLVFPNAVLTSYVPELIGVTVRHALQFVTQQVTTFEA